MASKSKKRSGRRASGNSIDLIRRNFERGDFKRALKDCRVYYRQNATLEVRNLLEHVYMARAEQLSRQGLREDCRRIVQELLGLGVTEPSVQAGLPELLLSVGMLDRLPGGSDVLASEQQEQLQVKIVDQAVVRPADTPAKMTEISENAQKIRAALEAVERGDESAALAHLNDIPRRSLFADWKLFVRGLIAYYRRDESAMLANWDRLDEERAAAKIAAPLKEMAGIASPQPDNRLASKMCRLEAQATRHPVLGPLTKLQRLAADRQWPKVLRTLRSCNAELRKLDAETYRRVISWLCSILVRQGRVDRVNQLARFADPLPIDPRWNRARASALDHSDDWGAERYWENYLSDLEKITVLAPKERDLARAMIHLYLSKDLVDDVEELRTCRCGADHSPEIEEIEEKVLEHFRQCQSLAPTYQAGYARLAEFHAGAGRVREAAKVHERWLEQVPDDHEALLSLSHYYLNTDQPAKCREFAERARQLKPLDKTISTLLWGSHVKAARLLAREGEFDRARDEMAAADEIQPERKDDYDVLARKAVLEVKAGCLDAARSLIEQTQEAVPEPTALWLVMAIEGIRIELPDQETWLYEKRWQDALKRRCRSKTAGLMCDLLNAHLSASEQYEGCQQHVETLLKYVRRCSRVKWRAEDLRQVCEFVSNTNDEDLLAKLVKRGLRNFPQAAYLHGHAGDLEIKKGPVYCNRAKAFRYLEQAIQYGTASGDPRDEAVVEAARQAKSFLDDHSHSFYDDEDDQFGEMLDDLEGVPRSVILEMLGGFCEEADLDPEVVMREIERRQAARSRRRK